MDKKVIWLTGMPGCGKSTTGRLLARELGVSFADLDDLIVCKAGQDIPRIFESTGEAGFRALESSVIGEARGGVIACGGGTVLDEENYRQMKKRGTVVFLDRPLTDIEKNIDYESRPLLAGGRDALLALYEKRMPVYRKRNDITFTVNGGAAQTAAQLAVLLRYLRGDDGVTI